MDFPDEGPHDINPGTRTRSKLPVPSPQGVRSPRGRAHNLKTNLSLSYSPEVVPRGTEVAPGPPKSRGSLLDPFP